MKKDNVVRDKSYVFALKSVKLYQYLLKEKNEFVLSKQILRAATSVGANVEEAIGAESKKDFQHKLSIAYKEARETHYWLRLLKDADYLDKEIATNFLAECDELLRILGSILKTIKNWELGIRN